MLIVKCGSWGDKYEMWLPYSLRSLNGYPPDRSHDSAGFFGVT